MQSATALKLNEAETKKSREQRQAAKEAVQARFHREYYTDYSLIFILVFMLAFGLVMLFSTSSYQAGLEFDGDSTFYLRHQLLASLAGLAFMYLASRVPYRVLKRMTVPAYAASVAVIFLVLTPLAYSANGATRWFKILGVSVQPAEVAKLGMIIFLAGVIDRLGKNAADTRVFLIAMFLPVPVCVLVYGITDNLSSALIIMGICLLMLFIAVPDYKRFVLIGAVIVSLGALMVLIAEKTKDNPLNYRSGGLSIGRGLPGAAGALRHRLRRNLRQGAGAEHTEKIHPRGAERYDFLHYLRGTGSLRGDRGHSDVPDYHLAADDHRQQRR